MIRIYFLKILIIAAGFWIFSASDLRGQEKPPAQVDPGKCWTYQTEDLAATRIAAHQDRAYISFPGAKIDAIASDGKRIWSTELGGEVTSDLLAHASGLFLVNSVRTDGDGPSPGTLRALSRETGLTIWSQKVDEAGGYYLQLYNGWVIVVSSSGSVEAFDVSTGSVMWKRDISSEITGRPYFSEKYITATAEDQLYTISLSSGEIDRVRKLPFLSRTVLPISSTETIVGDERGNIIAYRNGASDKVLWRFKSGGEISSLIDVGSNILASSHDNFVYFLSGRNGDVLWKRRLAGRALFVSPVSGQHGLISSTDDNGAAVIDLESGKVAGNFRFAEGESLVARPVVASELIFTATTKALHAFSLNGCSTNKESGAAK